MSTERTASRVCSDGRMVELAIHPKTGQVDFVVYTPKTRKAGRLSQVMDRETTYEVPKNAKELCTVGFGAKSGAVLLPTEPVRYGDEDQLLRCVQDYIYRYVELSPAMTILAANYAMFTWLYDRFDEVPYLRFYSPHKGVGKSRALDVVGAICYRPVVAGGSTSAAALRRMIDTYRGTFVGDEQDCEGNSDLTSVYIKLLNQGFQRGRPIILCNGSSEDGYGAEMFEVFGPKAVVTRHKFSDDALESRFLTVRMFPRTRTDVPLNLPREQFDKDALELRNMLLQFRFQRYRATQLDTKLYVRGIADRLNQIGAPLLSAAIGKRARTAISAALIRLNSELVRDRAESIPGFIVRYLSERWRQGSARVFVRDITRHLNGNPLMHIASISKDITGALLAERKVGQIIRDELGLKTQRVNAGYFVVRDMNKLADLETKYAMNSPGSTQRSRPSPGNP